MVRFKFVDVNGRGTRLNLDYFDQIEMTDAYGYAGVLISDGFAPALSYLQVKSGYHVVEYYTSPKFVMEFDFSEEYISDQYIYVDIQEDAPTPPDPPTPPVVTDKYTKVYLNGTWHDAIPYVYNNGTWHKAKAYVYSNGWKETK